MTSREIIVGSRGSKLALIQTQLVINKLKSFHPGITIKTKIITTSGDKGNLQEKGAFVTEIEQALLNSEIDLAIHSLKDMPAVSTPELIFSAILPREDASEVLIFKQGHLFDPKKNYKIGTGSPRRELLLKHYFHNMETVFIRGNVDTRIAKVDSGEVDGIILATAGLNRLNLQNRISVKLPLVKFLPAPGQGAIAIQTKAGNEETAKIVSPLNDKKAALTTKLERVILEEISGGCSIPLGAYALFTDSTNIELSAFYGKNKDDDLNSATVKIEGQDAFDKAKLLAGFLKENYAE